MLKIYLKNSYGLPEVETASAALVIIHHPYTDTDEQYKEMGTWALSDAYRVLREGGVVAIIQHDLKKLGTPPRHMLLYQAAIRAGLKPYDQKIWHRQETMNLFRKTYAYISILTKGKPNAGHDKDYINDVWLLPDSMRRDDYRDAFSPEIPRRLIKTFTQVGDLVVDPFLGSGTTMQVCEEQQRNCVAYEMNPALAKFYRANWEIINTTQNAEIQRRNN